MGGLVYFFQSREEEGLVEIGWDFIRDSGKEKFFVREKWVFFFVLVMWFQK